MRTLRLAPVVVIFEDYRSYVTRLKVVGVASAATAAASKAVNYISRDLVRTAIARANRGTARGQIEREKSDAMVRDEKQ